MHLLTVSPPQTVFMSLRFQSVLVCMCDGIWGVWTDCSLSIYVPGTDASPCRFSHSMCRIPVDVIYAGLRFAALHCELCWPYAARSHRIPSVISHTGPCPGASRLVVSLLAGSASSGGFGEDMSNRCMEERRVKVSCHSGRVGAAHA